jgi:outer membrane receptor for ferrienterochelin and colicins
MFKLRLIITLLFTYVSLFLHAQQRVISGKVIADNKAIQKVSVVLVGTSYSTITDSLGQFTLEKIPNATYKIRVLSLDHHKNEKTITLKNSDTLKIILELFSNAKELEQVVISGTMKEITRSESPVPVEVYSQTYFKKNPTANIYEALQNVNGVRPQLNCAVCNTGDIHINGLEGPYTMVLIDGMPIVSSLSTVYGLSGIPNSLVDRIEIVKGPASSLYGSEAVGGLINIITKKAQNTSRFSTDVFTTSWGEVNTDLGLKLKIKEKAEILTGVNYFNFQQKIDKNKDNFTDMTLQDRISVFQKWNFIRKENRIFNLAGRFMYEDRNGGDIRWGKKFRGGDSIYGESIYTSRYEILGNYQIPTKEKIKLAFSYNSHAQDSRYGTTSYIANQQIGFTQLTWDKKMGKQDFLLGTALRYTFYDDNTPATQNTDSINPKTIAQKTWLPGVFIQDEIAINDKNKLLLGFRYDYNSYHGNIFTPRIAYKWSIKENKSLRINAGTGFRVVNLFTEDHAALTGARTVEIKNELLPEKSYNTNINYIHKITLEKGTTINLDATAFYTYFNNRIVGDFDSDPNKISYDNLHGHAVSKGLSLNIELNLIQGLKIIAGGTLMENTLTENGITKQQILTEKFTGVWAVSYKLKKANLAIDYTGNVYSPMRLPTLSELDPRSSVSPWWSIQNVQMTFNGFKNFEIYGGVKNLLDWTPFKEKNPFIIARTNDPFDKNVKLDTQGKVLVTPENPYGLTFDPTYIYAPTQGIRTFIGVRYTFK